MHSNIQEWLSYIEHHYCYIHGGTSDGLPRFHDIAKKLGLDTLASTVITIGGTNGKGSCVIYLESILQAAGYKVGAYISPHVLQFNERIRINGKDIADDELISAFAHIDPICKNSKITYFEFITLATFYIFKKNPLDIVLLEVGMGGRLDAVNIINPDISIITTIDFDHTTQLGDTREKIGGEKAGIMRPHKPCICGDRHPPHSIIAHAKNIDSHLYCLIKNFNYAQKNTTWELELPTKKLKNLPLPKLSLQDAATAIMALSLLPKPFHISRTYIATGLKNANLLGRFQIIRKNPLVIVDVAHNPASAEFLAEQLTKQSIAGKTFAVVGILKDKDIKNTLKPMISHIDQWFVGGLNHDTTRGETAENIIKYLDILGAKLCYNYDRMCTAYRGALAKCAAKDRIIVFGSFYSVANILKVENISGN